MHRLVITIQLPSDPIAKSKMLMALDDSVNAIKSAAGLENVTLQEVRARLENGTGPRAKKNATEPTIEPGETAAPVETSDAPKAAKKAR